MIVTKNANSVSGGVGKRGLLMVNLGSPSAPTPKAIRLFLRKFLSDRRVVNLHPALWQPILHGIVLTARPPKVAPIYQNVWLDEGSPLIVHSLAQERAVQDLLPDVMVRIAMTYSEPSVESAIEQMLSAGVEDLTVVCMYPQYAASTVAACYDSVFRALMRSPVMPSLRLVRSWATQSDYIDYWARTLVVQLRQGTVDALVLSYHGVPQQEVHAHREYRADCDATTAAIRARLADMRPEGGLPPILQCFQSKFGPGRWIGPATIDVMEELPRRGATRVVVGTPGFVADCIETVDEIARLNRDAFMAAGGQEFRVAAPPNGNEAVGRMVADVYRSTR